MHVNPETLQKILASFFTIDELRELCFHAKIKFDNLPSDTLSGLTIDIVKYCERHNCYAGLVKRVRKERPHAFTLEQKLLEQRLFHQKRLRRLETILVSGFMLIVWLLLQGLVWQGLLYVKIFDALLKDAFQITFAITTAFPTGFYIFDDFQKMVKEANRNRQ